VVSAAGGVNVGAWIRTDWAHLLSSNYNANNHTRITGRYRQDDSVSELTGMLFADNDTHQAAQIRLEESSRGAWYTGRTIRLQLSDGAKFRKIQFTSATAYTGTAFGDWGDAYEREFSNNVWYRENEIPMARDASGNVTAWVRGGNSADWNLLRGVVLNDGQTRGNIILDGDTMYISRLHFDRRVDNQPSVDPRGILVFNTWLSLAPRDQDDNDAVIELTGYGEMFPEEGASVPIVRARNPVEVKTVPSPVRIGLQFQDTENIAITEVQAGVLQRSKEVRVTISDMMVNDVLFDPSTRVSVTEGDLRIGSVHNMNQGFARRDGSSFFGTATGTGTNNGGTLIFAIETPSTTASTILIDNVRIRVDRTVPETNLHPYKVVVWGTAIAENFGTNRDEFSIPGITADYINIATLHSNLGLIVGTIEVPIGENFILVNGVVQDMPVAAYVSAESNSTMVPIRFVSQAIGVPEDSVVWDPAASTVTIYTTGRVIQFTSNSTMMVVDGVASAMVSPDGLPVRSEITDERMFIPFRQVGIAFGLEVGWRADPPTAIYRNALS